MIMKKLIVKNQKMICFILLVQIIIAFLFGGFVENADNRGLCPETGAICSAFRKNHEDPSQNMLNRILNTDEPIFRTDLSQGPCIIWDGKYMDWNVLPADDLRCIERVTILSPSGQMPISDTENATKQNFTYIVNKSIKKIHQTAGYARGDGENGRETVLA